MTEPDDQTVVVFARRRRWRERLRRWRPLLIAVLAAAVLATGAWLVFLSSVLAVDGVKVTGNSAVSAARIEKVARAPLGTPLARVDLSAIQARVEAIPTVREVSVSRSWPGTVQIDVVERTPVAVVSRGAGLQAVDIEGVLFGSYQAEPKDLPLIRTAPDVKAEVLAEAAKVVTSLRADIAAKVRYVDVESVDKIVLRLANGPQVLWGSAASSRQKAEVLAVLLGSGKNLESINVSTPRSPTTR